MTVSGVAYELPMQVHPISVSESSLLRTPIAGEAAGGAVSPEVAKARNQTLRLSGQMIDMVAPDQLPKLTERKVSVPTPTVSDASFDKPGLMRTVTKTADLLGTPRANAANSSSKQVELGAPKSRLQDQVHTDWGKFEPAIRRWETILGRQAPEPTKPDGKDGNHRLSSKFTEWMMGLPDGWITGHGLKRNDELKLAGNGVVPQQAELALRLLLELPEGER
jgi:hypothetical protein